MARRFFAPLLGLLTRTLHCISESLSKGLTRTLSKQQTPNDHPSARQQLQHVYCDHVECPWVSLPADVMLLLAERLDNTTIGRLRLICSTWRAGVDSVLEELELAALPDNVLGHLDKWPVLKSLKLVRVGSHPCSPRQPASPLALDEANPSPEITSPASPGSRQLPHSTTAAAAAAAAAAGGGAGPSSLSIHLPGSDLGPSPSPRDQNLITLLKGLRQRNVPVKHLAMLYESPYSMLHLPPGLRSLTVVNLDPADQVPDQDGPAMGQGAAGISPLPTFTRLDIPGPTWTVLQQLSAIKFVNGLPDLTALATCTQLTKLVLQGEAPAKPKSARKKSKARTLTLEQDLGQLTGLQELEVRWTRLLSLPSQLSLLTGLQTLNLSDCLLKALPEEVGQLRQLQRLAAAGNPDLGLPSSLGLLQGLRALNLSWTRCSSEELFELGRSLTVLEELKLTGNNIRQLPPSIMHLKSLKVLVLSVNQLESLPAEISSLTALEHLDCSLNHVVHLENLPPSVARLNLQTNGLKSLPADFGQQLGRTLQWLDISNNSITLLPASIGLLHRMQTLRLSFNQLQELNCGTLAKLPKLKLLEAYYAGLPSIQKKLQALQRSRPDLVIAC